MAHFEEHCRDCERILGDRHEKVNRWIDELFAKFGPKHRRFRHCWNGVREARRLFGDDGAKAAIVHIIRDCGDVPRERDYDENKVDVFGIRYADDDGKIVLVAPEYLRHDGMDEKAFDKFKRVVEEKFAMLA